MPGWQVFVHACTSYDTWPACPAGATAVTSCTHGTTVAPGHQPARSYMNAVLVWLGDVVVRQSVRQMLRKNVRPPTVKACIFGQNSPQFSKLPCPCPVMKLRSS